MAQQMPRNTAAQQISTRADGHTKHNAWFGADADSKADTVMCNHMLHPRMLPDGPRYIQSL